MNDGADLAYGTVLQEVQRQAVPDIARGEGKVEITMARFPPTAEPQTDTPTGFFRSGISPPLEVP
jgi:hypothetical protein